MKAAFQKQAIILTQEIMERWYALDTDLLAKLLDENSSWIGAAEGQFYMSRKTVLNALESVRGQLLPCTVSDQIYEIADTGSDWCIVAGRIVVTLGSPAAPPPPKMALCEPQRLTFVWRSRGSELRLSHIHVSNNASVVAPDEEFPIKASRAAYEYLASHISKGNVTVLSSDRTLYRLDRSTVSYLSAANEYMHIHCEAGDIRVHHKLSTVQTELFSDFLNIHRSYSVNSAAIRTVRPYEIELTDGTRLPVARSRYAELCEKLGVKD
jgi:hypothetical protein